MNEQTTQNEPEPKVSKFTSAYDLKSGRRVLFGELRDLFFAAAQKPDGDSEVAKLRKEFNLVCPHCKSPDAGLTFSFGSQNPDGTIKKIAGTNFWGNPAHLKNKPENKHRPECNGIAFAHESYKPDTEKGYKIHLNLKYAVDRHPRNRRLYMKNSDGRIITLDPELKGRETVEISSAEKFQPLLTPEKAGRVKDSLVICRDQKIPWNEFYLPSCDDADFSNHVKSIVSPFYEGYVQKTFVTRHPLLARLNLGKASASRFCDENGESRIYKFPQLRDVKIEGEEKPISIQPELRVNNQHLFNVMNNHHKAHDELLVIVEAPFLYKRDSKTSVYVLVFTLKDPDMMCKANLHEIKDVANERAQKRQAVISQQQGPYTAPAA